ncbi:MAG: peptidoglycan editing factor PgeF [Chloroflexi bacterium]|nr:peptidoglycan editing factor PgeF [Chloroflexota bacterium]
MDLSARSAGSPALAEERRQRVNMALSLGSNALAAGRQVHGDHIEVVSAAPARQERHLYFPATDALVTNLSGITLLSLHADCVPVLLYDPEERVVGLAHAGWKGTILRIAGKTVTKMVETFGCRPENILAAIGPSIGPQCYEVGEDVVTAVREEFQHDALLLSRTGSQWSFDLWAGNRLSLLEVGVLPENIEDSGICTHCRHNEFFSHRAEKGSAGRFGALVAIAN